MHDVEAHVAGTAYAQHGVEVGAIVVHQCSAVVNELCYLRYLPLEKSQGIGVCHHHCCHAVVEQSFKVLYVHNSLGCALHLDDVETADGCRGWIGAVGRVGNDDLGTACVTIGLVVCADNHQAGKLAVGACAGL